MVQNSRWGDASGNPLFFRGGWSNQYLSRSDVGGRIHLSGLKFYIHLLVDWMSGGRMPSLQLPCEAERERLDERLAAGGESRFAADEHFETRRAPSQRWSFRQLFGLWRAASIKLSQGINPATPDNAGSWRMDTSMSQRADKSYLRLGTGGSHIPRRGQILSPTLDCAIDRVSGS